MKLRNKTIIYGGGALLLLILSVLFFVFMMTTIRGRNMDIAAIELKTEVAKNRNLNREALAKTIQATQAERAELLTYFVKEESDAVVSFLEDIEALGRYAGADVTLSTADINAKGARPKLHVTGKAEGTFSSLITYVELLETAAYELVITDLSFRKPEFAEGVDVVPSSTWNLTFTLDLISFGN